MMRNTPNTYANMLGMMGSSNTEITISATYTLPDSRRIINFFTLVFVFALFLAYKVTAFI